MESIKLLIENFFELANAMSIYILIGLLVAGFLKEILPKNFIFKHLGKGNFSSVIKATTLGIPMPVCSCSVIPLAKSLQKEGASKGAVSSFLISTPITGVDSILATYSFFGLFFTIYRLLSSIVIAIIAGVIQNLSQKTPPAPKINLSPLSTKAPSKVIFNKNSSCSSRCCQPKSSGRFSLKRVFTYAFDTLFGDIAKSLFIGLIIGAIFSTFLPKELILASKDNLLLTYLLVLIVSMPFYVCATSSLPIGASLLSAGVPLGGVFVFLTAGPATNAVTMSVVKEMFGRGGLFIYLGVIGVLSIIFGYILDSVLIDVEIAKSLSQTHNFGIINYIATALMLSLMIFYLVRRRV